MFQYAFCRYLQEEYGQDICFDISGGTQISEKEQDKTNKFILDSFYLKKEGVEYCRYQNEFRSKSGMKMKLAIFLDLFPRGIRKISKSQKIFHYLENIIQKCVNPLGIYTAFDCFYKPYIGHSRKICVSGMFTCEKYFNSIKEQLLEEFTPKCGIDEKNQSFLHEILESNSICVHVRKGNSYVMNESLNVCTKNYYNKAIKMIESRIKNPVFFIFSNDLNWCKDKLELKDNCVLVDANDGAHPVEELRLMMNCKHFILSNSTMSWWAQYLCRNDKKIVISPNVWSKGKIKQLGDLMDECWVKIEV